MRKLLEGEKFPYLIIRHNFSQPYQSAVVQVAKGRARAESAVEHWDRKLTEEEKAQGWGHFLERTTLVKHTTDVKTADELYQYELLRYRKQRK